MKTYILYNPHAGAGNSREKAEALISLYEGEVTLLDITEIEDYAAFLAPLEAEDAIVICGGDGTLNRFANAIEGLDCRCDIQYFAIGTGNDFLHDLDAESGEKPFLVKQYLKDLPVVEVNGKKCRFLNGIGFGIDGYCCEIGDKKKAAAPDKPVNYTAIAIKGLLFHYKPTSATVTVDGKSYTYKKVWIAATMKGRFYGGGMMTAPKQDRGNDSGEVTLVVMHGSGKLKTLMVFPSIFKGEHVKHEKMVAVHTGKDISVTFDRPTALQIDGETVLDVTTYHVTADAIVPATV